MIHVAEQPGWGALDRKTLYRLSVYLFGKGWEEDNRGWQRKSSKEQESEKEAIKARVKSIKSIKRGWKEE